MSSVERIVQSLLKFSGVRYFTTIDVPQEILNKSHLSLEGSEAKLEGNKILLPDNSRIGIKFNGVWSNINDIPSENDTYNGKGHAAVMDYTGHIIFRTRKEDKTDNLPGKIFPRLQARIIYHGPQKDKTRKPLPTTEQKFKKDEMTPQVPTKEPQSRGEEGRVYWRLIINSVHAGSGEALSKFSELTVPFIRNSLLPEKFAMFREELFSIVAEKLTRKIQKKGFDFNKMNVNKKNEEIFLSDEERIKRYIAKTVENALIDLQRRNQVQINADRIIMQGEQPGITGNKPRHTFEELLEANPDWREVFNSLITEKKTPGKLTIKEFQIITLRDSGVSRKQIAEQFQVSETHISHIIKDCRKTIDVAVLSPAGFKRLEEYKKVFEEMFGKEYEKYYYAFDGAVRQQRVESLYFAGHCYLRDRWFNEGKLRLKILDTKLLEQRYICLSQIGLPRNVRQMLYLYRLQYPEMFKQKNNLQYMLLSDLQDFLIKKKLQPLYKEITQNKNQDHLSK